MECGKKLYIWIYIPISVYWFYQGMLHTFQQAVSCKPGELFFLLFCSCVLFWSIAPGILIAVLSITELSYSLLAPLLNIGGQVRRVPSGNNAKKVEEEDIQILKRMKIEETNEKTCSICWKEFEVSQSIIGRSSCWHCYHAKCLKLWIMREPRCPLCRGAIAESVLLF